MKVGEWEKGPEDNRKVCDAVFSSLAPGECRALELPSGADAKKAHALAHAPGSIPQAYGNLMADAPNNTEHRTTPPRAMGNHVAST